jgi:hypothetical protein
MNELDPALKRLMKWSRRASPPAREEVPFGFAGRVTASRKLVQIPTLLAELQQIAWGLACVSLAVIVCGFLLLMNQPSPPPPASEIPSALDFVANYLPQ